MDTTAYLYAYAYDDTGNDDASDATEHAYYGYQYLYDAYLGY